MQRLFVIVRRPKRMLVHDVQLLLVVEGLTTFAVLVVELEELVAWSVVMLVELARALSTTFALFRPVR